MRLHVGCGRERLAGWLNVDIQLLPGVDLVADVTRGLGLRGVEAVFAEHFLEHLEIESALDFLLDMRRSLVPGGALRLSTPNLDWVWLTHYAVDADAERRRDGAILLNRAFHGWEHRFLWNRALLGEGLAACGFDDLRWHRHGESRRELFRGLERHETYPDEPDLPHVLVVEATRGEERLAALAALRARIARQFRGAG
jgi:predicted SAM-dependent methyltransferase